MTLKEFAKKNGLTTVALAKLIGCGQPICHMWINGDRLPNAENMKKIMKATNGEVMPNDFYEVE